MSKDDRAGPVVLFDGVCNLCNRSVRFIIDRDPGGVFRFAPLQSEAGEKLLEQYGLPTENYGTFILIEGGRYYVRSEAALRVAKLLGGGWGLAYAFMTVPAPLRDRVYDYVARNRYKWFGRTDECMAPGPGIEERFLE